MPTTEVSGVRSSWATFASDSSVERASWRLSHQATAAAQAATRRTMETMTAGALNTTKTSAASAESAAPADSVADEIVIDPFFGLPSSVGRSLARVNPCVGIPRERTRHQRKTPLRPPLR